VSAVTPKDQDGGDACQDEVVRTGHQTAAVPRDGRASFAGHSIAYRVAGRGPALVLVKPHRHPRDYRQLRLLADRYRVIQMEPGELITIRMEKAQ
jgi:hypothetical protein